MYRYEINFTDHRNGATSTIDNIERDSDDYTADDYMRECAGNADKEWCDMLSHGDITVTMI